MIDIKKIEIEFISGAAFGVAALLLSLLVGIFSGNSVGLVLLRAFFMTIGFSLLGFICILVLKKFVPEFYQLFHVINKNDSVDFKTENVGIIEGNDMVKKQEATVAPGQDIPINEHQKDEVLENEFSEIEKKREENFYSDNGEEPVLSSHNILDEKKIKYEPKIAAQAIRTMMKRDE